MRPEIDKVNELVEDMDTAVLVTRRPSGWLVARPIAKQQPAPGADCWFVAPKAGTLDDLAVDPRVSATFFRVQTDEWVAIDGVAKVAEPHRRMLRIGVEVRSAVVLEKDMPAPLVLFELPNGTHTAGSTNLGRLECCGRPNGETI